MEASTSKLSRLVLEQMLFPTPPKADEATATTTFGAGLDEAGSSSDRGSDSDACYLDKDGDDEPVAFAKSPAKLVYTLDQLPARIRDAVRDVFMEPPNIALQQCLRIDDTYAFQMTELVTRSIRIRAPESGPDSLSCTCGEREVPCRHLIWLLDQVAEQTLYDRVGGSPLTMTTAGYAQEMGDPFESISQHHLDVLADGLHCRFLDANSCFDDADEPCPHRVLESRELLSAMYDAEPDDFRPDIFESPAPGKKALKRHDADCTIFRMLLDNHHFFHYFLSLSRAKDPVRDRFRKLCQRVDHVLRNLDACSSSEVAAKTGGEPPCHVAWAARHISGAVKLIRTCIYTRDRPFTSREALSAARALVHILAAVVARSRDAHAGESRRVRNLYLRLIGDHDTGFVIDELDLIPEASSQFIYSLEATHERIGVLGAPVSYVEKMRALIARLRTSTAGAGLKRCGQGDEGAQREPKRMK